MEAQEKNKEYEDFFKRLDGLSDKDRTNIKRELGKSFENASFKSIAPFYKVYYGKKEREELHFLMATCYCFYNKDGQYLSDDFIKCLRRVKEDLKSDSLDNRVISLLDIEFYNNIDFFILKFSRLLRMLKQKGYKPNFPKLLKDIRYWDYSTKPVQLQWTKDFFLTYKEDDENVN